MPRKLFLRILPFLAASALLAQDAGMVLSTSVGYRTQRASLKLTDAQAKEADQMAAEAQTENAAGRYGEAMRRYHHGTAAMNGAEWTPAVELAYSLTGKLDHAIAQPGNKITISLVPLYPSSRAATEKVNATVVLVTGGRGNASENVVAPAMALDPAHLPFTETVSIPQSGDGDYTLQVRLSPADGAAPQSLRNAFVKALPIHIEALSTDAQKLKTRLAKAKPAPALATAQFVLAHYEQADRGEVSPARYNFRGEFSTANALLDSLEAGKDPFAGKQGDMRRAYLSKVDQTLQPYRLFIPKQYDGSKATPLVVSLHGMGGDENSMFDGYGERVKVEAQRLGFIVACPKGREPASMYRGPAEQDVLDVMAEVQRDYKIDKDRIYLMGHSMGGYGTWSVSIAHPELFAALAPISGGGSPAGMEKIKSIPEYVTHGDDDRTVNVSQSRAMVAAGKKLNAPIVYNEVPGGSHGSVAEPAIAPMFDFFLKQSKPH